MSFKCDLLWLSWYLQGTRNNDDRTCAPGGALACISWQARSACMVSTHEAPDLGKFVDMVNVAPPVGLFALLLVFVGHLMSRLFRLRLLFWRRHACRSIARMGLSARGRAHLQTLEWERGLIHTREAKQTGRGGGRKREREREKDRERAIYTDIYIYVHMYVCPQLWRTDLVERAHHEKMLCVPAVVPGCPLGGLGWALGLALVGLSGWWTLGCLRCGAGRLRGGRKLSGSWWWA